METQTNKKFIHNQRGITNKINRNRQDKQKQETFKPQRTYKNKPDTQNTGNSH